MSLLKPPDQMTVRELEGMIRWHESFADTLLVMREPSEAARTRELATKYREELHKRLGSLGEANAQSSGTV